MQSIAPLSCIAASLLAASAPAATVSRADIREVPERATLAASQGRVIDSAAHTLDLSRAWGDISRASPMTDGQVGAFSYSNNFESLALAPTPLNGQPAGGVFTGLPPGYTDVSGVVGFTSLPRGDAFAVNDPLAGNASTKLRVRALAAQPPNLFFTGLHFNMAYAPPGAPAGTSIRATFSPTPSAPATLATDAFFDTLATLWTHEVVNVTSGFIVDRLLWGGSNSEPGVGLPVGAIAHFYNLGLDPNSLTTGLFFSLTFPAGYSGPQTPGPNGEMTPPVNAWFRIIHQAHADATAGILIDFNDGFGPVEGYRGPSIAPPQISRFTTRGSFEAHGSVYIDNLDAAGAFSLPPVAPPLSCISGTYTDNLQWLLLGPLTGQNARWTGANSTVIEMPPSSGDRVIRQTNNVLAANNHLETNRTALPLSYAFASSPLRLCVNLRLSDPNHTVRAVAAQSITDDSAHSRIFLGREAPPAPYTSRVYVQINPAYDPIDEEGTPAPFANNPVVGIDVADTGFVWPLGSEHNLCLLTSGGGSLDVSVDGLSIFTGAAFVNSIDRLAFESEYNTVGAGDAFFIDDVMLECDPIFAFMSPPALALVYLDDLEWGFAGVTIGAMDDDGNPATPFRWASAANMPLQQGAGANGAKVLRMENLFRDTDPLPPNDPNFFSFAQASTRLPNVTSSGTRGWAQSGSYMLTDGATTRLWSPGQAVSSSVFSLGVRIAFSSVTQTLWHTSPNPAFACPPVSGIPAALWTDSGVSLASLGIGFGDFFSLSTHKNLAGNHTFRVNGRVLRNTLGVALTPQSLNRCDGATLTATKNLDALFLSSGDEDTAPTGSILYADNIRAWALPCIGDTNDDGIVNFADLNNVLTQFGQSGANLHGNVAPDADQNGVPDDSTVNFADLNAVLTGFGVPCT